MLQLLNWQISRNNIIYEFKENKTNPNRNKQTKNKDERNKKPVTIIRTTTGKDWLASHVLKRLLVKRNFCLTRGKRSLKV